MQYPSNKSFVIWGCNSIDMNKIEQGFPRCVGGLEIKYELWTSFPSLIMQGRHLFLGVVQLRELRLSNIIPPPTNIYWLKVVIQRYKQIHIEGEHLGVISQVYTSHMDCEH